MSDRALRFLAFSDRGNALAHKLRAALGGTVTHAHGAEDFSLSQWTQAAFADHCDLVFVGAAGIAVRAIAPFLKSKAEDPAVVVVDERGEFAISLVSGHLGGANDLARELAALCGAAPVITTATDRNGIFSVDAWARTQGCRIPLPHAIKTVSSRLLAGEEISLFSALPIEGEKPDHLILTKDTPCDVAVDYFRHEQAVLPVVPRCCVLGVGCRRGTTSDRLERVFSQFCRDMSLWPDCILSAASIDLKAQEPGLLEFLAAHQWRLHTYSAEELQAVLGDFTPSEFVKSVTGVDNVCQRSAVLCAGGPLLTEKYAKDGVTLALAARPLRLDWRWQYG